MCDVLEVMQVDFGICLYVLCVDGGVVVNNFLMQFQFDIFGICVERLEVCEVIVLGAVYFVGLVVGFWQNFDEL